MKFEHNEQKLTQQELSDFKKEFKIKLPDSYKEVILEYNGGSPEKQYFEAGRVMFLSIKYGEDTINDVIKLISDVLPKYFFPFADYNEGMLCISLDKDEYGKIYWFEENGEVQLMADSFDKFMDGLSDDLDD